MKKLLKKLMVLLFVVLPYVYLAVIWNELPANVPTHFDMNGVANDWSSKNLLVFLPSSLPLFVYFLMRVIPVFDPKKNIDQMAGKYFSLQVLFTTFMSVLTMYLLSVIKVGSISSFAVFYILMALLFACLGNYFPTIRPNYFLGIRTPWTLESAEVWKRTHFIGGRIWMFSGCLLAFMSLWMSSLEFFHQIFLFVTLAMVFVPVVFSYFEYKRLKRV